MIRFVNLSNIKLIFTYIFLIAMISSCFSIGFQGNDADTVKKSIDLTKKIADEEDPDTESEDGSESGDQDNAMLSYNSTLRLLDDADGVSTPHLMGRSLFEAERYTPPPKA